MRIKKRWIARLVGGGATAVLAAGLGISGAGPASASTSEQVCSPYGNSIYVQTSTQWARASYQICGAFTPTTFQPQVRMRIDWPRDCTIGIAFPPSVPLSCPLSRVAKEPAIRVGTGPGHAFFLPVSFRSPTGFTSSVACRYAGTSSVRLANVAQPSHTITCRGRTYARHKGVYAITSNGPRLDVRNDGQDWLILPTGTWRIRST